MMTKRHRQARRRGYALVEIAMAVMVLMAAMSLAVKVLATVGQQRRATERRLLALQELANAVERINAEPFDALDADRARELARPPAASMLSKADWHADVAADDAGTVAGKRVTVRVRWKGPFERVVGTGRPDDLGLSTGETLVNQRRDRQARRGTSLIELMLIVGSMTMILSLCGVFLHLLLRIDSSGRAALADGHAAAGFARQFRRDVHAAGSAKLVDKAVDLTTAGGPSVRYEATRFGVERRETSGGSVTRHELYRLDALDGAEFWVDGPKVEVSIRRVADFKSISPRPSYRVEARLGRDTNWADAGGAGR